MSAIHGEHHLRNFLGREAQVARDESVGIHLDLLWVLGNFAVNIVLAFLRRRGLCPR